MSDGTTPAPNDQVWVCVSIIRGTLDALAKALGVRGDQAEEVLRSERSARARLSRRQLFAGAGAVAAGSSFWFGGFPENEVDRMMRFVREHTKKHLSSRLGEPIDVVESVDIESRQVLIRLSYAKWVHVELGFTNPIGEIET